MPHLKVTGLNVKKHQPNLLHSFKTDMQNRDGTLLTSLPPIDPHPCTQAQKVNGRVFYCPVKKNGKKNQRPLKKENLTEFL
jgi:hypothetical protein